MKRVTNLQRKFKSCQYCCTLQFMVNFGEICPAVFQVQKKYVNFVCECLSIKHKSWQQWSLGSPVWQSDMELLQGYHTRALNGGDSGTWGGLVWAGSDVAAIYTQWQTTFPPPPPPSAASRHVSWPCPQGLADKSWHFKTISFVLYTFLGQWSNL